MPQYTNATLGVTITAAPWNGKTGGSLKQMDFDGKYEYSNIVTVSVNNNRATQVTLYPNPATDLSHLDMTMLPAGSYVVRIFNMQGRIIQQNTLSNEIAQQLDIRSFSPGKYIIQNRVKS